MRDQHTARRRASSSLSLVPYPTRLRARVRLIYRSFSLSRARRRRRRRRWPGVYRKYSYTNSDVGHRFLSIKLKLMNNALGIDRSASGERPSELAYKREQGSIGRLTSFAKTVENVTYATTTTMTTMTRTTSRSRSPRIAQRRMTDSLPRWIRPRKTGRQTKTETER